MTFFCTIFCPDGGRNGERDDYGEDFDAGGPQKNWIDVGKNASPVKIATELEISQCIAYTELKRGQETDDGVGVVLDENFRPA